MLSNQIPFSLILNALPGVTLSVTLVLLSKREQREKEEIEKYRMERPKIQQQFSDLKVRTECCHRCDFCLCFVGGGRVTAFICLKSVCYHTNTFCWGKKKSMKLVAGGAEAVVGLEHSVV